MLQQLGDSIWTYEQFIGFGGLPLRHRMTVIRFAGGGVLVHSPTTPSAELADEIQEIGQVAAIVAPSWWHDLYLSDWLRVLPEAALYGAPTLVRFSRSLPFTGVLTNAAPSLWAHDLEQHHVEGIGLFLDEVVFYHRASGSLILADLLFNLDENDRGLTKILAPIVIGPVPGCRFARLYRPFILDRRRFRDSIERILEWEFRRIIVGHGAVVENEGKEVFRSAFRWLLK
jgi:Domain of unknown function (DUF4336)